MLVMRNTPHREQNNNYSFFLVSGWFVAGIYIFSEEIQAKNLLCVDAAVHAPDGAGYIGRLGLGKNHLGDLLR